MRGRGLEPLPVAPAWALALLLAGCWAAHDGALPPAPPDPPVPPPDAAVRCEGPGADACGCLGGQRRCDTCEVPCPDGSECVARLGVCVAEELLDVACTVDVSPRWAPRWRWGCGGDGTRLCAGDATATLQFEDPMRGVCLPWSYCAELGSAEPPLDAEVACRSPVGERVRGLPPVDCPGERLEGAATCGPWCPRPSCAEGVCVGVGDQRGFGLCALRRDCRAVGWQRRAWDECEEALGGPCACLQLEGPSGEPALVPVMVSARACEAYRRRFPESVRCLGPEAYARR